MVRRFTHIHRPMTTTALGSRDRRDNFACLPGRTHREQRSIDQPYHAV